MTTSVVEREVALIDLVDRLLGGGVVIVGDITPERARSVVESAFGGWKGQGPTPNVFPPPVPANKPAQVVIPATGRVQSEVTLGECAALAVWMMSANQHTHASASPSRYRVRPAR